MNSWHYAQNNQSCGPVDLAALQQLFRTRVLAPDALVWKEGMPQWAPANTVPEFAALFSNSAPPPLPSSPTAPASGGFPPSPLVSGAPPPFNPPPNNTPPLISPSPASAADPVRADIDQNKVFAILAYLGILFLVPLLAAPKSPFARYHTNQGLILFITSLIVYPFSWLLVFPLAFFTFGLGIALPFFMGIGLLVMVILGIVNAASGQCKPLPLIGRFELVK